MIISRILGSIVVSIPACHAGDRGSIPRRGDTLKFFFPLTFLFFDLGIESSFEYLKHLPFFRNTIKIPNENYMILLIEEDNKGGVYRYGSKHFKPFSFIFFKYNSSYLFI